MVKRLALLGLALLMVFTFACKKKEEAPPQGLPPGTQQVPGGGGVVVPPGETSVTVPSEVQKSWSAVVLTVQDKTTGKAQDVTIDIGGEKAVPGTPLKIKVIDFLPDFRMEGSKITSVSNEPNMPAARVQVMENGKEVFNSFLFSKMPQVHPMQHEKYAVTLKEGIKKG
jgi:hypothetical protein